MKNLFNKSLALVILVSAISIVLNLGTSLIMYQHLKTETMSHNDRKLVLMVVGITIFLLLLNIKEVLSFWLNGKGQELFVKRIVGIQQNTIVKSLVLNLNYIICISCGIGFFISIIISFFVKNYFTFNITIVNLVMSWAICGLIVNFFGIVLIGLYNRKKFIGGK